MERPNILWLTYEDTSPQFVSCYGQTPVVTTPAIDALAASGVRFTNAFATAPVCSASRSAIITGCSKDATGLGHHRSKCPIPRDLLRGFPWYLRQAGYYATNNQKTDYNIADELVSFEDLAPTVLALAGVAAPDCMTGRAFLGRGRQPPPPYIFAGRNRLDETPDLCRSAMDGRFVYTRNFFPHLPVVKWQKYGDVADIQRAIRRDYAAGTLDAVQAELVAPTRPTEYLYDLAADTWEIRNLAGLPEYAADLERLRAATFDRMRAMHDVLFLPEREMAVRAGDSTPYERRADPAYNPLDAMLEAAVLVGGGADAIPRQLALLAHDDSAVRYWAAVGLYAARAHLGPHVAALRARLEDGAALVEIELAAALYGACRDAAARRVLERHLASGDVLLVHQAVERILYMPEVAADFAAAVAAARERGAAPGAARDLQYAWSSALDVYAYLYGGEPLYNREDAPYEPDMSRRAGGGRRDRGDQASALGE